MVYLWRAVDAEGEVLGVLVQSKRNKHAALRHLSTVLSELRLLCSARLDSHLLLTVVLARDGRLLERLRSDEFLPLASACAQPKSYA